MNYWIFTSTGEEKELKERLEKGSWPIYKYTKYKQELTKGDRVVIYHGGMLGKKGFVGTVSISSELIKMDAIEYVLHISDADFWERVVKVNDIKDDLGFIRIKENWGLYFQGGVSRIPKKDYEKILSAAKLHTAQR